MLASENIQNVHRRPQRFAAETTTPLTAAAQWRSRTAATFTANTASSFRQQVIYSNFSNMSSFWIFSTTVCFLYRKGLIRC